jgi:O-antigen/teichoic acid export membrane protein
VGLVLYPRLATLPKEEVHRLTAQTCRRTLLLTGLCALAVTVLGPWVIVLWYGADYAPAGDPLGLLCIGALAWSIYVILTRDFTSHGRQLVNIAAGLPALILNVILNFVLIPQFGILGAAMSTAISYSLACVVLLIFYLPWSGVPLRDILIPRGDDFRYFWTLAGRALQRVPAFGRRAAGD